MCPILGAVIAAVLAASLSACGGSEKPQDPAVQEPDAGDEERVVACELVPPSDVADILGLEVQRTEPREVDSSEDGVTHYLTGCTYIAEDGVALRTATVLLTRAPEITDPAAALQRFLDGMHEEYGPYEVEPVPELGKGAGWNAESEQLIAFLPGWQLSTAVDRHGAMPGLEGARTLASRVLERLP
jgi:hypothetical protein